jgi:UDP-N-acetylmuramoyl-tripeptide--D-alanyl-D-alanine ligase
MSGVLVSGRLEREFSGVALDTRTLRPGELYVAIKGERFDGADFASAALGAGAGGVVVPKGRGSQLGGHEEAVVLEVGDTVSALQALARRVRRDSGATVVAITGSAGKTTTKEVTAEFLEARYRVVRNRGNLNNHIGLPLSLIELTARPDVAVVELGMNHAGEIRTLVGIAEPDVRVWTNVGDAHLEFFASVDELADAKAEILEQANAGSVLVCNSDDERVRSRAAAFAGRVITFGMERPATVHASAIVDGGVDGMAAQVSTPHGVIDLKTPLIGRANLANVLASTAVALELGISRAQIAETARRIKPAAHRGDVLRLSKGITVIDDSYNANPTATRKALDLLSAAKATRRVAVVGEMLELGERSIELHEQVGRAAHGRADVLIAVGGEPAAALARAAKGAGMAWDAVSHYPTIEAATQPVLGMLREGDLVLVKGSRGVHTDRIVDRLKAELA